MPRKTSRNSERHASNGLREALLGVLAIRPMSGYDVTHSYTRALQQIWYAPKGQVYPTLRKMHAEKLLDVKVEVQDGKPNRKVYSLTDSGRLALIEWLSSPATLPRMHHEFIHKLFLLNHVPEADRQEFVSSYVRRSEGWASELRRIEQKLIPSLVGGYADSAYFQLLALQHLIRIVECEANSARQIAIQLNQPRPNRGSALGEVPETSTSLTGNSRHPNGIGASNDKEMGKDDTLSTPFAGQSLSPNI